VTNCVVDGGVVGCYLQFGATATIRECRFLNQESVGLVINSGCHGELFDTVFEASMLRNIGDYGLLTGSGNLLMGGFDSTIISTYSAAVSFHGNDILNAGGLTIRVEGGIPPTKFHDYSSNYWGTTDFAQISNWIIDQADDTLHNYVFVDFRPIAIGPLPVEPSSMGSLKALFADPK